MRDTETANTPLSDGYKDNPSLWTDHLAMNAEREILDPDNRTRIGLPDIEAACRALAERRAKLDRLDVPSIGFDKPTNVYVVTELYQSGGHRVYLEHMIAARPHERHLVIFTGARTQNLEFGLNRMRAIGAFAVAPDPQLTLYDCYSWLRKKLAAYAARRLFLFHHPEDVLATAAAYEVGARYGRRLYVVRHSDTRPTLGAELSDATHIVIRDEHAQLIREAYPDTTCLTLPLAHSSPEANTRRLKEGFFFRGIFTTVTSGGDHKFTRDEDLSFCKVIAGIVRASRGRHIHIGPVSQAFRQATYKELEADRLPADRLIFIGEVASLSAALEEHRVDLYLGSFPIGGGLSVSEAASAGLPLAVFDPGPADSALRYIAGAGHRPPNALTWTKPKDLFAFLRKDADDETLANMAKSSIDWYNRHLSSTKFSRRLNAIIAVSEGRARRAISDVIDKAAEQLFDADHYLRRYPDVAEKCVDPLFHFNKFGKTERRSPNPVFDIRYYLSQLSPGERKMAEESPLAHYAARGEPRGLRPSPLFDPELVATGRQLKFTDGHCCLLAAYLERPHLKVRTHTFFDGPYYARKRGYGANKSNSLLADFLGRGAKLRCDPHPLIDMARFGPDPLSDLNHYVSKPAPSEAEMSPFALFNPRTFSGGNAQRWTSIAPNLLWAHMIEGNTSGIDPHAFVSTAHVAHVEPETLLDTRTIIERIARKEFIGDTHPLIRSIHIFEQAPWLIASGQHPTQYFLEHCIDHNVDAHPYFSTQHYLYNNPDVAQSGMNPLVHYLTSGQFEGRLPHLFFDGNYYYQAYLKGREDATGGPLIDYIRNGAGLFRPVQPTDGRMDAINRKLSKRLFQSGDDDGAADLMLDSTHPPSAAEHPTLTCEVRELLTDLPGEPKDMIGPVKVYVPRPAVVHPAHIAPASGAYELDGLSATSLDMATVVGGNDGVMLEDGRWLDPGLRHFSSGIMQLKEGGAAVDIRADNSRILLRRHRHDSVLQSAIFGCGTYSANYYHFLIEILPRVMAADRIAPPDVPIIADDHMPVQHYQILRTMFPERNIRKIYRGFSYTVKTLFLGDVSSVVHDVVDADKAPFNAVRYHPEIIKHLNKLAQGLESGAPRRKLFFKRESHIRRFLNSPEIEHELVARGFEIVHCDKMSFRQQMLMTVNADVIVAQSGAHLANILFARPGTQVYALYSNAQCTNYYLWDGIGRGLGLNVVNIAGWRIIGTNGPGIARIHEDFTIPPNLLLPFFPVLDADNGVVLPEDLRGCLRALYHANDEADTITAAWAVTATQTPDGFENRLRKLRERTGALLDKADDDEINGILEHPFFADFGRNVRSGLLTLAEHSSSEKKLMARTRKEYEAWAAAPDAWMMNSAVTEVATAEDTDAGADEAPAATVERQRLLALAMLYLPARDLPLLRDISGLPVHVAERLVSWVTTPPFLFREGDDEAYVVFAERLLEWFDQQFNLVKDTSLVTLLYRAATNVDLGQLLLIDRPLRGVVKARNRLLERLTPHDATARKTPRKADGSQGRIRVGVMCRTFDKGPDSETVLSFFRGFDKSRYEIFAYSIGFLDRVVSADDEFDRNFNAVVDHRRVLIQDPQDMRETLLADDLDVFLHANATTYGLREQELGLYRRVAPIQMVLNSHIPMPMGFPSFDAYVTGKSDDPEFEIDQADYSEKLLRAKGPVICYLNSLKARREPLFDRAEIGLAKDDLVLMNAGSLSKLRHECLRTFMQATKSVPTAKLLLAPYNPGWVARSQAFAFNRVLREMADDVGLALSRRRPAIFGASLAGEFFPQDAFRLDSERESGKGPQST